MARAFSGCRKTAEDATFAREYSCSNTTVSCREVICTGLNKAEFELSHSRHNALTALTIVYKRLNGGCPLEHIMGEQCCVPALYSNHH